MATASELYLSPEQRTLLLAALQSGNNITGSQTLPESKDSIMRSTDASVSPWGSANEMFPDSADNSFLTSNSLDDSTYNDLSYDHLKLDDDFEYDFNDIKEDGDSSPPDHENRKHSMDNSGEELIESGTKRRESEEKVAKKPGRKPLTNEPTTKRKAQNRAAQRAFRERKEKHLKDLEDKVTELEKLSENTSVENKRLKNQVDALQAEVKQYRQRLSLEGEGTQRVGNRSASLGSNKLVNGSTGNGGFSFDFPLFGQVAQHTINNGQTGNPNHSIPAISRNTDTKKDSNFIYGPGGLIELNGNDGNKTHTSTSTNTTALGNRNGGNATTLRNNSTMSNGNRSNSMSSTGMESNHVSPTNHNLTVNKFDELSSLFSPSLIEAVNREMGQDYLSMGIPTVQSTPLNRNGSLDFTTSPSASSVSQNSSRLANGELNSSCETSPEPMMSNSPGLSKTDMSFKQLNSISEEGENKGFSATPDTQFSWLAQQNGGSFEPMLFNDYREPVEQINSNIDMNFFDDALVNSNLDFGLFGDSSSLSPSGDKKPFVPGLEQYRMEDDTVHSNTIPKHLGNNKKPTDDFDLDSLCSDLRKKAVCSELKKLISDQEINAILDKKCPNQQ